MAYTRQQLIDMAYQAEQKYGLPKGMLVAQLHQESSDGTNTTNPAGPVGVMQIQPATGKALGFDPSNPAQAIDGAGRIMQHNLALSGGDVGHALSLYYAGSEKGIGPRSRAYPGQVGSKWDDGDLMDSLMGGGHGAPQPEEDDTGAQFDKLIGAAPASPAPQAAQPNAAPQAHGDLSPELQAALNAPDPNAAPQQTDQFADLKKGMQTITDNTHSPYWVRAYVRNQGYDPDSINNLEANVAAGKLQFDKGFAPHPLQHDTATDFGAGAMRGADDVFGTLNQFAAYMDKSHPMLAALDQGANAVAPSMFATPQTLQGVGDANIISRKAYDANYNSLASGTGRLVGQIASAGPLLAPAGAAVGAAAAPAEVGGAANPIVSFVTGQGGNNLLTRAASMATAGAGAGAAGNALTASSSDAPLADYVTQGAEAGAIGGPVLGGLNAAGSKIVQKVAPGIDAGRAALAKLAQEKYGITLDGSQITSSPLVRRMDNMLSVSPFSNNVERDAAQRAQFTQAVGRTFGADAPELTPEVMQGAKDRIGGTMNDIAARTPIHADDALLNDLSEIENSTAQSVTDQEFGPVKRQIDNVLGMAAKGDGTITGEMYQNLTKKGSPLDIASSSSNPSIRSAAIQIRGALDDALERSASPEDVKALQQARLQYKNMKTVEPLISKDTGNQITPSLLNNRVSINFKNRAYQGAGDLDELSQIGQQFLKPPSSSGTAENAQAGAIMNGMTGAGATGLALLGHHLGVPTGVDVAGATMLAGTGALRGANNALVSALIHSKTYKDRLLGAALNSQIPSSVNFAPPALAVGGNRLLQDFTPPPGQGLPARP